MKRGRGRQTEIFASINDSFNMLKKITETHTARLDFVDIIKPTILRYAVATNRQRRGIASVFKYIFNNDSQNYSVISINWNSH